MATLVPSAIRTSRALGTRMNRWILQLKLDEKPLTTCTLYVYYRALSQGKAVKGLGRVIIGKTSKARGNFVRCDVSCIL